jgi:hypothetical protein
VSKIISFQNKTNTTKKTTIRHVSTVPVTVDTWPDGHVSQYTRGYLGRGNNWPRVLNTRGQLATCILSSGQLATCIYYTWPIGRVYLLHVANWPRVLNVSS